MAAAKAVQMAGDSKRERLLRQARTTEIVEVDGDRIEVRQPTQAVRDEWLRLMDAESRGETAAGEPIAKVNGSVIKAHVWLTITCSHDPDTGAELFTGKDEASLMQTPCGGVVDVVSGAAMRLMRSGEKAGKNSKPTLTDSSSSE